MSDQKVFTVKITNPNDGKFRVFCLSNELPSSEISDLYKVSFEDLNSTVGFCDENGVYYPFSALLSKPSIFSGKKLYILSKTLGLSSNKILPIIGLDSEDTLITEEQVRKAFQLLDLNGDYFVHKEEFIEAMTKAYNHLFKVDAGFSFAYNFIGAKDLAVATASSCYQKSDPIDNYRLTFDDFCSWYMSHVFDPLRELAIKAIDSFMSISLSDEETLLKRDKSRPFLTLEQCYDDEKIKAFIDLCQDVLALNGRPFYELLATLSRLGKPTSLVSFATVANMITEHVNNNLEMTSMIHDNLVLLLQNISEILDVKSYGNVQLNHLISLLSVSSDHFDAETFSIIYFANQENDDKYVNDLILYTHLCQIIKLICYLNPEFDKVTNCSAESLAYAIYLKLILSAEINRKQPNKLTVSEFIELFVHGLKLTLQLLNIKYGYFYDVLGQMIGLQSEKSDEDIFVNNIESLDLEDQVSSNLVSYSGAMVTIEEARKALGLFEYSTYDIIKYLVQLCDPENKIEYSIFQRGILRLLGEYYIGLSVLERSVSDFVLERLSSIFVEEEDSENRKFVFETISIALMLFCEDDSFTRAEVILALLRPKALRFNVALYVVTILFKACYCLNPQVNLSSLFQEAQVDAKTFCMTYYLQEVSTDKANKPDSTDDLATFSNLQFLELINSTIEFLECESERRQTEFETASMKSKETDDYSKDSRLRSFSEDGSEGEGLLFYLDDEKFPPSAPVYELRATASLMGLENYRADDLIDKLGGQSFAGMLTSSGWAHWFIRLVETSNVSNFDMDLTLALGNKIFNAFKPFPDADEVNFAELAAGLAFLCCKSPVDERLMVAFTLMDSNSDGFISFDEFTNIIKSILLIISVSSKLVEQKITSVGASIDELAQAAAKEGMVSMGLKIDEELNLEMFCDLAEDYVKLASVV